MPEAHPIPPASNPPDPKHQEVNQQVLRDETNVSLGGIMATLVAVFVTFGLVFASAHWTASFFRPKEREPGGVGSYDGSRDPLPPHPRLEPLGSQYGDMTSDVFSHQLELQRQLHSYGITDEKAFVHIPIETAMRLAVDHIPAADATPLSYQSFGLLGGGESHSGRIYQEAPPWFAPVSQP